MFDPNLYSLHLFDPKEVGLVFILFLIGPSEVRGQAGGVAHVDGEYSGLY